MTTSSTRSPTRGCWGRLPLPCAHVPRPKSTLVVAKGPPRARSWWKPRTRDHPDAPRSARARASGPTPASVGSGRCSALVGAARRPGPGAGRPGRGRRSRRCPAPRSAVPAGLPGAPTDTGRGSVPVVAASDGDDPGDDQQQRKNQAPHQPAVHGPPLSVGQENDDASDAPVRDRQVALDLRARRHPERTRTACHAEFARPGGPVGSAPAPAEPPVTDASPRLAAGVPTGARPRPRRRR